MYVRQGTTQRQMVAVERGAAAAGRECHKIPLDILLLLYSVLYGFTSPSPPPPLISLNIVLWPVYTMRVIATINDNDHLCHIVL